MPARERIAGLAETETLAAVSGAAAVSNFVRSR